MFPSAVKGHMPFSPTYPGQGNVRSRSNSYAGSGRSTAKIKSCPMIGCDRLEDRSRSLSAPHLRDVNVEASSMKAAVLNFFKRKSRRSRRTEVNENESEECLNGRSPPEDPPHCIDPLPVDANANEDPSLATTQDTQPKLHRSHSIGAASHIPKLEAITEEDESIHLVVQRHLGDVLAMARPNSDHLDRRALYKELYGVRDSPTDFCPGIEIRVKR